MRFLLLLPWLISQSSAERGASNLRVASADSFRIKCNSLPHRTIVDGSTCYFAIRKDVAFENGNLICNNNHHGASMYMDKSRERVLKKLFLDPSSFHDASTTKETKNVLCSYDAKFTCPEGDLALPGRCVLRGDKPMTWAEASAYCRLKGAANVAIHNDDENAALTEMISRGEGSNGGWLLASHVKTWSAGDQPVDYWNWFFAVQTPANLKCNGEPQHAVLANNAKKECSTYGQWKVDDAKSKNYALCEKNAECPLCGVPPKRNDEVPKNVSCESRPVSDLVKRMVDGACGGRVYLKTYHNTYLRANRANKMLDQYATAGPWEKWTVEARGDDKILLRSDIGYLGATPANVFRFATQAEKWEEWTPIDNCDDQKSISLKSWKGLFVRARENKFHVDLITWNLGHEHYTLECWN